MKALIQNIWKNQKVTILMHDTDAKATTVEYLPKAIEYLRSQGYEFRKIEQPEGW